MWIKSYSHVDNNGDNFFEKAKKLTNHAGQKNECGLLVNKTGKNVKNFPQKQ